MIHELKTHPEYFRAVEDKVKKFEIRKADRDFKVNDRVKLREWDPRKQEYTGKELVKTITYITRFEQPEGQVVFGIR